MTTMLRKIGLIGWESIEPVVLSATLRSLPLMLTGPHGCNKTEGAEVISKALLGTGIRFIKYDTPLLNSDDFLGYPNPKSLAEGKVEFIGTDISIWAADAVLFDEINRANPFTAAKLMECIRTKRVMGMETKVKHVFSAVNPPARYDSIYMDLATASRWVMVEVPETKTLAESDVREIIKMGALNLGDDAVSKPEERVDETMLADFKADMMRARSIMFRDEDINDLVKIIGKILKELAGDVSIQPRQGQSMLKMLLAINQLEKASVIEETPVEAKTDLLLSCIPEVHGICKQKVEVNQLRAKLNQFLSAFKMNDPLLASATLAELSNVDEKADQLAWASGCISAIEGERAPVELKKFGQNLNARLNKGVIEPQTFNLVADTLLIRYLTVAQPRDIPKELRLITLGWDRTGLRQLITNFFC